MPVFSMVRSVVLVPILLGILGEHHYGLYVLAATSTSYLVLIGSFGLDASIYRFAPSAIAEDAGRRVVTACLLVGILVSSAVALVASTLALVSPAAEEWRPIGLVVGLICVLQTNWVILLAFRRVLGQIYKVQALSVGYGLVEATTLIVSAWVGRDVLIMFLCVLAVNIPLTLLLLAAHLRAPGVSLPERWRVTRVTGFGGQTVLMTAIATSFFTIDKLWLGYFSKPADLAFYAPAFGLASVLGSISAVAIISVANHLGAAHDADDAGYSRTVLRHGLSVYLALALPAMLGLMVTAGPLLSLMIGPRLAEQAAPVAAVFAIALFLLGIQRFPAHYLRVRGESKWVNGVGLSILLAYVLGLGFLTMLRTPLAPVMPTLTLLALSVQTVLIWRRGRKHTGPVMHLWDVVPLFVAAVGATAPGFLLDLGDWRVLVGFIVASAASYFGAILLWIRFAPAKFQMDLLK